MRMAAMAPIAPRKSAGRAVMSPAPASWLELDAEPDGRWLVVDTVCDLAELAAALMELTLALTLEPDMEDMLWAEDPEVMLSDRLSIDEPPVDAVMETGLPATAMETTAPVLVFDSLFWYQPIPQASATLVTFQPLDTISG